MKVENSNNTWYQDPFFVKNIGTTLTGALAGGSVFVGVAGISSILGKQVPKIAAKTNPFEVEKALYAALEKSGMKNAGVEIKDLRPEKYFSYKEMEKYINSVIASSKQFKKTDPAKYEKIIEAINLEKYRQGFNAGFQTGTNSIIINLEKMGLAGFHELGHAINFNTNELLKAMSTSKKFIKPIAYFVACVYATKVQEDGDKNKNGLNKMMSFVKDNAGATTFSVFVPSIIEEITASIRGQKLAKPLLSKDAYKKMCKVNLLGASTYIITAAATASAVYVASKVKDYLEYNI